MTLDFSHEEVKRLIVNYLRLRLRLYDACEVIVQNEPPYESDWTVIINETGDQNED